MDAICFVLGISNLTQVRVGNLSELVYKQGQAGVTKASVTIVFNNEDKQNSPVGYLGTLTITFGHFANQKSYRISLHQLSLASTNVLLRLLMTHHSERKQLFRYEMHDKIIITRQIVIGGRNRYLLNSHNVQQNQIQNLWLVSADLCIGRFVLLIFNKSYTI